MEDPKIPIPQNLQLRALRDKKQDARRVGSRILQSRSIRALRNKILVVVSATARRKFV
jgi:hypothetical protein